MGTAAAASAINAALMQAQRVPPSACDRGMDMRTAGVKTQGCQLASATHCHLLLSPPLLPTPACCVHVPTAYPHGYSTPLTLPTCSTCTYTSICERGISSTRIVCSRQLRIALVISVARRSPLPRRRRSPAQVQGGQLSWAGLSTHAAWVVPLCISACFSDCSQRLHKTAAYQTQRTPVWKDAMGRTRT